MIPFTALASPALPVVLPAGQTASLNPSAAVPDAFPQDSAPASNSSDNQAPARQHQLLAYAAPNDPVTADVYSVTQSVYLQPPSLDPIDTVMHVNEFPVTGTGTPSTSVSLYMSQDGGTAKYVDTEYVGDDGKFTIYTWVSADGTYTFMATANSNGVTSGYSAPITVEADLPPAAVGSLAATAVSSGTITIGWDPPGNADLDHYFIDRDGQLIGTVHVPDASFTDAGLQPESAHCYDVTAVDKAGNQSKASEVCTGTTPADKLADLQPWRQGFGTHRDIVMSRDGSTVVYTDEGTTDDTAYDLYVRYLDLATGENVNISPKYTDHKNNPPKYTDQISPYSFNPAVSSDGKVMAFSSYDPDWNGSGIYVYDRSHPGSPPSLTDITANMEIPDDDCWEPSISGDGTLIAYMCGQNDLYLYNRKTGTNTLMTSLNNLGYSWGPAVSADGSTVAFMSWLRSSPNTYTYYDYVTVYDVAAGKVMLQKKTDGQSMDGLSISDNGRYIAYTISTSQTGRTNYTLHVYDRMEDKIIDVDTSEDYSYQATSISSDGRQLLATYRNMRTVYALNAKSKPVGKVETLSIPVKPTGNVQTPRVQTPSAPVKPTGNMQTLSAGDAQPTRNYGANLHDVQSGQLLREIGSPGLDTYYAATDGNADKFVMQAADGLYLDCLPAGGCGATPQPANPLEGVSWTAPSDKEIGGELKPGTTMTIHASGKTGEQVQADITYTRLDSSDSEQQTIALTEEAGSPGNYSAEFPIPAGTTAITALQAELTDHSHAVSAAQLIPVKIGGTLQVSLNTPYASALDGLQLVVTSPTVHMPPQTLAVTQAVYDYSAGLPDGTDYLIRLMNGSEVLAEQDRVTIRNGDSTKVELAPVFSSSLTVQLNGVDERYKPDVTFADADSGRLLGTLKAGLHIDGSGNYAYEASSGDLKGIELQAGERIQVRVNMAGTSPYLLLPATKTVQLKPGTQTLDFILKQQSSFIFNEMTQYTHYNRRFSMPTMDSALQINLWSNPGEKIQAEVLYQAYDDHGKLTENKAAVDLTEAGYDPNYKFTKYTGSFQLHAGIAAIESYSVSVDGLAMPDAYPINKSVLGRLNVEVANPLTQGSADWSDLYMDIVEPDPPGGDYWGQPLNGSGTYSIDLPGGRTYAATERQNTELARSEAVSLASGQTAEVALIPKLPAVLSGRIVDKNGNPITGVLVKMTSAESYYPSTAWSGRDGSFRLSGAWTGESAQLQASVRTLKFADAQQRVKMASDSAETSITITMQDYPEGTIAGVVEDEAKQPVANARVQAAVQNEGVVQTYSVQTDKAGKYSLTLPEGSVSVHADAGGYLYSPDTAFNLQGGQNKETDLIVVDHEGTIDVNLYTKYAGSDWQGPMGIDWRYAVHIGLSSDHPILDLGNPLKVRAAAGDTVQVCVNGTQAGLPSTCQSTTLDANRHGTVNLRLSQAGGRVTGSFNHVYGYMKADFYRADIHGKFSYAASVVLNGLLDVPLPQPGHYKMVLSAGDKYGKPYSAGAVKEFDMNEGQAVSLGNLDIMPFGIFGGHSGNDLQLSSNQAVPGSKVEVSVHYADQGSVAQNVRNALLDVRLPQGLDYVDGSMAVNGQSVIPQWKDGDLTVAIGNGGAVGKGDNGAVQFELAAGNVSGQSATTDSITAGILYSDDAGDHEETIGQADIQRSPISLEAPSVTALPAITVSGSAPAGEGVAVYDGSTLLGKVTASSSGFWTLDVTLPSTSDSGSSVHLLRAETGDGTAHFVSDDVAVTVDADKAQLVSVSMQQPDGRVVTVDPTKGTAHFPYVYIGGGFIFKLQFKDPKRVTHVGVYMGTAYAAAVNHNGVYEAYINPRQPGPVWVDYDVLPSLANLPTAPPNPTDVRSMLPPDWQDYTVEHVVTPNDNGTAVSAKPTATLDLKTADRITHITYSMATNTGYTPTQADLTQAQATGLPVYGLSTSREVNDNTLTLTFTAYVPRSVIAQAGSAQAAYRMMMDAYAGQLEGSYVRPKGLPVTTSGVDELVEISLDVGIDFLKGNKDLILQMFKGGRNMKTAFMAMYHDWHDPDFDKLMQLQDRADALCDPAKQTAYDKELLDIGQMAMAFKIMQMVITLTTGVIGFFTAFVGSAVLLGINLVSSLIMNHMISSRIESITDRLNNETDYCYPPPVLRAMPTLSPIYVRDPSGYVYEGIPSNRLSGVTATAMEWNSAAGQWENWDASWFEQENPTTSDPQGRYGWFVPDGQWKVHFEKNGYVPADSGSVEVPPPQYNVNQGLISYEPPEVTAVQAESGGSGIEIGFSKPMLKDSFVEGALAVRGNDGSTVTGSVYAVDGGMTDDGQEAGKLFRFVPDTHLLASSSYQVTLTDALLDYANVPLAKTVNLSVEVEASDTAAPANPTLVEATVNQSAILLTWTDPTDLDLKKIKVYWKKDGDTGEEAELDVNPGVGWASLADLTAAATYDIRIAAVDAAGNESSGTPVSATTPGSANSQPGSIVANVTGLQALADGKRIHLTWQDSTSSDIAYVFIAWQQADGSGDVQTHQVAPGVQHYDIAGLSEGASFQITVSTFNRTGVQSDLQSLVIPISGGSSGGSGNNGGSGSETDSGGGSIPNASNQAEWVMDGKAGEASFFEGMLTLAYSAGSFPAQSKLMVSQSGKEADLPEFYQELSNRFTIKNGDTVRVGTPLTLALGWDAKDAVGMDLRRLGVYRMDEQHPGQWIYAGGVLQVSGNQLQVQVEQLGTYAVLLYSRDFPDLAGHWGQGEIEALVSRHILHGTAGDRFEPDRPMTRAELATMLVCYLNGPGSAGCGALLTGDKNAVFLDVPSYAWYAPYLREAKQMGLVSGYAGKFRPDDPVSREEMIAMLFRALALQTGGSATDRLAQFTDGRSVSPWAQAAMNEALIQGYVSGYGDHTLKPLDAASRAEVASVLYRMLLANGKIGVPHQTRK